MASLIEGNPFSAMVKQRPGYLVVLFMRDTPAPANYAALRTAIKGPEEVRPGGRHAYLVYPDGQGRSKLTPAILERHLGSPGTARNWNTVRKLRALAEA